MIKNKYLFVVFLIQISIAFLNYYIAVFHYNTKQRIPMVIDILCGISWTMTGVYKLFESASVI